MRFSRSDACFTAIILALVAFLSYLFVRDINLVVGRGGAEELGTIVLRKRTVTRRQASSYRWERLRHDSPVYRGDTIRTADLSEAQIVLGKELKLDVFENSLLTVSIADGVEEIVFQSGSMSLSGAGGPSGEGTSGAATGAGRRIIRSGDSVIECEPGAALSVSRRDDRVSVDVSSGSATFTDSSGARTTVSENAELVLDATAGTAAVVERLIVPTEPAQNERLVWQGVGKAPVPFVVSLTREAERDREVVVELSRDAAFSSVAARVSAPIRRGLREADRVSVALDDGVWYWRAVGDGDESPVRRFSVTADRPVEPALPAPAQSFAFRVRKPAIRFSWDGASASSATYLELSRTDDFSDVALRKGTELSSLTLDSLDEGTWYWRVVPSYRQRVVGLVRPSAARSFSIARTEAMAPLAPIAPVDGAIQTLAEVGEAGVSFSWKPDRDAVAYELRLLSSPDSQSTPLYARRLERPWGTVSVADAAALASAGTYYWTAIWLDREGNASPAFAPRPLNLVDGRFALAASFPPDGYAVADSLLTGFRFLWKGTFADRTVFELARDANFTDIVASIPSSTFSAQGQAWKPGAYYWRVRMTKEDGSTLLETPAREIRVVPPLDAPRMADPAPGSTVTIRAGDSRPFRWDGVAGADYYHVSITPDENGDPDPVFDIPAATGTAESVPLGKFPDGRYRVVTQAFGLDSPSSTRVIGYREESAFTLKKVRPVSLVSPAKGTRIAGLDARKKGVTLRWRIGDAPEKLTVRLRRNGAPWPVPLAWRSGVSSVTLPSLPEGTYSWDVRASSGEFDLSSGSPQTFVVLSVPKLPAPKDATPGDKAIVGPDELKARELRFAWSAVPGATHYTFRVRAAKTGAVVFTADDLVATEAVLTDFSILDRGSFVWEVSAKHVDEEGIADQDGVPLVRGFTIDLPAIRAPAQRKDVEYYGR